MVKAKKITRPGSSIKKKLGRHIKTYNFFLIFAIVLGMIAGVLLIKLLYRGEPVASVPQVQLGSYEYDIQGGKATKLTDEKAKSLKSFLESAVKNSGCDVDGPDTEHVIASTKDRTQVLIDYGCFGGGAHMFVVYKDNSWHSISPTNHFETLYGLPECGYVDQNNISREIAPVCYTDSSTTNISYTVR